MTIEIPIRELVALAGVSTLVAATLVTAVVLIVKDAYRQGFEAGAKSREVMK